nr:MAG: nonstructural protein [Microvirus sp.]
MSFVDKMKALFEEKKTEILEDKFQVPIVKRMFAILDRKQNIYDLPWFADSKIDAIRGFTESISKPGHPIAKYPTDYWLVEMGLFERRTGKFELHSIPDNLGSAQEFMQQP